MILPLLLAAALGASAAAPRAFVDRLKPAERKELAAALLEAIDDWLVLEQEKRHHLHGGAENYEQFVLALEGRLLINGHKRWVPLPAWDPDAGVPPELMIAKPRESGKPRAAPRRSRPRRFPEALPSAGAALCAVRDERELDQRLARWHDFVLEDLGGAADSEESSAVPIAWCWHAMLAELKTRWRACRP